jgi:adenylate cyclase
METSRDTIRAKRAYRAHLRHELRTPLNAVIGYSEMLIEDAADADQVEIEADVRRIHEAGQKLLAMIDEVADLPQVESGQAAPDLEQAGVSGSIRAMIKTGALVNPAPPPEGGDLLVVDDHAANRDILARQLTRQGHRVTVATDGEEALNLLRTRPFDLVLLDLILPGMNGYQVLASIRTNAALREVRVIMISALDELKGVTRCIELGADDYLPKPFDPALLAARVTACLERKRLRDEQAAYRQELQRLNHDLEVRNKFIRQTFGRYTSDELAERLLETPDGLNLGGETREVTILMADLRGFTSTATRLAPGQVVKLLNIYLGAMADIIMKYQGVIDEFIGDAILVIFGAPIARPDDATRAVACALAMQLGMEEVNERNRRLGLPAVAMGIGINTGEVVAGNIGSFKRAKYSVIGSPVILTSRIESYTVGGQILISETTRQAVGDTLRLGQSRRVEPKGGGALITIHEVTGLGGEDNLFLPVTTDQLIPLKRSVRVRYSALSDKHATQRFDEGVLVKISLTGAELCAMRPLAPLSDLKLRLLDPEGGLLPGDLYAKVTGTSAEGVNGCCLTFTSVPPELAALFSGWLGGQK